MPSKPPTRKKRAVLIEQDGKCCLIEWNLCLMPQTLLSLICKSDAYATWEHLTPRARGGSGARSNIRLSHKLCNHKRSDKPLPGYEESARAKPAPPEPLVLAEGQPAPEPFTNAWLRWKGYL